MSNFINLTLHVHATLTEPMLGMEPANKDIFSQFIASKAPDAESRDEEIANKGTEEYVQDHITVFPRNEDGTPFLWDYQIKGFFKDSCGLLKRVKGTLSSKVTAYKKIIDGTIFIGDRQNPIYTQEPITICERRLRASTPQGERISLAASEQIAAGSVIDFDIWLMNEEDVKLVQEWLSYGEYHGFGQWRNSGKGKFVYSYELEKDGEIIERG